MNEETKQNKDDIREKVLTAIASGRVKMRPRWHFILTAALTATGMVIVGLALLYLASFILFVLRETGVWFVPTFGAPGWFAFIRALPWTLILLTLIFVVILEILVRRFSFAYRKPLLYSIVGIVCAVLIGGFLIVSTSFHRNLFDSAARNQLPFMGGFYRNFGMPRFGDIHHGVIIVAVPGGFIIQEEPSDETDTVILAPNTQFPTDFQAMPGDRVVIFGNESGTFIQAVGIRELPE